MAPPAHWGKMHMMQGVLLMVLVLWGAAGKGLSSRALKAVIQWGRVTRGAAARFTLLQSKTPLLKLGSIDRVELCTCHQTL
jgi:hypothetical protein